ncbi:hypothetical protein QBC44DRAFT_400058 [Cladorrhinum sp. PSN332]|nr:hypothetical protein QBC44DRAFT_400058 [Cladorrhinum sp. PSN332]
MEVIPAPDDPRPGLLVKKFSWEMEARGRLESDTDEFDQLRANLVANQRSEEIQMELKRLEKIRSVKRTDDEAMFNQTRQELMNTMASFQSLVPEDISSTILPACWSDVEEVVSTVQARWNLKSKQGHSGRIKTLFHKMCSSLNNHSAAFKVLPTQNDYVSVIAGAVGLIVKASANYSAITEFFVKSVSEINDAVAVVQMSGQIYPTPSIQQLVMRLYTRIFSFLHKCLSWYACGSMSRFRRSFNEDVQRMFEEDLKLVRDTSLLLGQHIQFHTAIDGRQTRMIAEDTNRVVHHVKEFLDHQITTQKRFQEEVGLVLFQNAILSQFQMSPEEMRKSAEKVIAEYSETIHRAIAGSAIKDLLVSQAAQEVSHNDHSSPIERVSPSPSIRGLGKDSENFKQPPASCVSLGTDIRPRCHMLEKHIHWEHVYPFIDSPHQLCAHPSFISSLTSFTTTIESSVLYAHGRYQNNVDSNLLRLSAGKYVTSAQEHGIPVISYFCRLSPGTPPATRTRESLELISLIYALIRQVTDLLPAEISISIDLSEARFASLDGTLRTWDQAISLLSDLIGCIQLPQLLFVIDGLGLLEDEFGHRVTLRKVEELVKLLVGFAKHGFGDNKIFKALFTTSGLSAALCKQVGVDHVIACGGGPTSPGEAGRGKRSKQFFSY